ncbi:putative efflux system component YknX [Meiothermus luteus]|jgi:multidrug efflux pump subunit AcrA (membrane-fusion protein)|uniref:Putative efflux system component YknX n=1 Tax=Meiothermus luteus TaxID=2026184 RepID=A0A399EFM7_9DEIN|nr:efflux RND transporter periplasmic adaptor subunit [Meiothermus luteus]RIH83457.1 putative efflux system component YknX [Meiothermus luteus]RMH56422.1 MAG: HlyD family efflux transporter periplasmic adaptor subunit [Deinococcota bacterium]
MKRWFWWLLLLSLGLTAFGLLRPRAEQGLPVNVVRVERGAFVREVRANGVVEARVYPLTFTRPGRVAEVRVREGERVEAGQVLAVLETADEAARLEAAKKTLEALRLRQRAQEAEFQSSRVRLENQLEEAQRSLRALQELLEVGGAARAEVEQAQRRATELRAQLESLSEAHRSAQLELLAQMEARQGEVAALERALAQSALRAPVAGTVASVGYLVGVEAAGGGPIRLVEAGSLRVQARLAEADIPGVRPGQPVRLELDALPGEPLLGRVERMGVQAEVAGSGGSAVLPVFIRFLEPKAEALARPGLSVTARITTLRLQEALLVPLETLVEEGDQHYVWKIDEQTRRVKKVPVALRARNLTRAVVEGIEEGSLLVSLPPETLKEGLKVRYRTGG